MTRVLCGESGCVHNKNVVCQAAEIDIDLFEYGDPGCDQYRTCDTLPDYQDEYYKRVGRPPGPECKQMARGKRLEASGFVLFTEERVWPDLDNGSIRVTEERTGILGRMNDFVNPVTLETTKSVLSKIGDVRRLPDDARHEKTSE
ncbi:hypothetical protein LJC74_06905 [Eubacteriales bacterium OttesenSCG-928-A19]|nr:hypothetical protein [Eubacteriales bacterium OttesenSCG-928-A19]